MYAHDVCHEYVLRGHDENDSYQHDDESNQNGDESQRPEGGNHDERCGHDTNARCDGNRGAVGRGLPAHSSTRAFTSRRSRVGAWGLDLDFPEATRGTVTYKRHNPFEGDLATLEEPHRKFG